MGPVRKANPGSAQVIVSNNLIGFCSWRESVTCKAVVLCISARKRSRAAAGLRAAQVWEQLQQGSLFRAARSRQPSPLVPALHGGPLGVTLLGGGWDAVPGCSCADICISPLTDLSSAKRKFADSLNEFKFRCIGDAETDDEICIGESWRWAGGGLTVLPTLSRAVHARDKHRHGGPQRFAGAVPRSLEAMHFSLFIDFRASGRRAVVAALLKSTSAR